MGKLKRRFAPFIVHVTEHGGVQRTWQLEAPLSDLGVVAVGHPEDGVVDAGQTRHPVHVLGGGVDVAVLQVVEDGVVEENRILQQQQERRRRGCERERETEGRTEG